MDVELTYNPALTVAIALAAGMVTQSIAYHLRIPSIVLLLGVGVLLGPEVAGIVDPASLGSSLQALVGMGVAIILLEGGLQLELRRLRREQVVIRRLVTLGAVITAIGGALAAHHALGWDWRLASLFGALVIVTGPTVVTPLLRRLRIRGAVPTVLEAEGVLIDAIGAITAAVVLEVVLRPSNESLVLAAPQIALRLGFGVLAGLLAGGVLAGLLRFRGLIPQAYHKVLTLSIAVLIFELANSIVHESGLAAATITGMVLASSPIRKSRDLVEFKEQLTVLLIGMLFILLAANTRVADVIELGWAGVITVVALIVLVRPIEVLLCSIGTSLSWRERVLIAWIAPRGIVAAAVASLFAIRLESEGIPGGAQLQALVFATIAATVIWSGLTGAAIAQLLGLRRRSDAGWLILGTNELALELARLLKTPRQEVVCVDDDPRRVQATEEAGIRVLLGNAFETRLLVRAEVDVRTGVVGLTQSPEVNLLFVDKVHQEAKDQRCLVAIDTWSTGVTAEILEAKDAEVLFGGATDVAQWSQRIDRGEAQVEWWSCRAWRPKGIFTEEESRPAYLPMVRQRWRRRIAVGTRTRFWRNDRVAVLIDQARQEEAHERLEHAGFVRREDPASAIHPRSRISGRASPTP
ncbi:MAG TPA: sodium:proton antiporter [Polyangiales bacterium]|nr:sodium:proton antiporter [Polyangiales bacterium]